MTWQPEPDHASAKEIQVYLGLGSNLGEPRLQIQRACDMLAGIPRSRCLVCSPLYRSKPMGPVEQPDFINAVAGLHTGLEPHVLLGELQSIEQMQGRERGQRWGPRTLDLDLLLYGDQEIREQDLTVPHPGLEHRAFVLFPLFDIAPDLEIPGLGSLSLLVRRCSGQGLWRVE